MRQLNDHILTVPVISSGCVYVRFGRLKREVRGSYAEK